MKKKNCKLKLIKQFSTQSTSWRQERGKIPPFSTHQIQNRFLNKVQIHKLPVLVWVRENGPTCYNFLIFFSTSVSRHLAFLNMVYISCRHIRCCFDTAGNGIFLTNEKWRETETSLHRLHQARKVKGSFLSVKFILFRTKSSINSNSYGRVWSSSNS